MRSSTTGCKTSSVASAVWHVLLKPNVANILLLNFCEKKFNVDYERQIFWETFSWQVHLLSEFLPEICWEKIVEDILFVFCFDIWPGAPNLATRLRLFFISKMAAAISFSRIESFDWLEDNIMLVVGDLTIKCWK